MKPLQKLKIYRLPNRPVKMIREVKEMSTAVEQDSVLFTFDVRPLKMTDAAFYEFCQSNKDFRFEIDKRGNLIIMPPTFLETSRKNIEINF